MPSNPQYPPPSAAPRPRVSAWADHQGLPGDIIHPAGLGKNKMYLDLRWPDDDMCEHFGKPEQLLADEDGDYKPMQENRELLSFYGYGIDAVYPPFDAGRSRNEFEYELTRHGNLVGQRWPNLNRLVLGSEKVIQDAIINLSQGDFKDNNGKTLDIEHYLNISWETARDAYNAHHATEPGDITSGFRLDPKSGMTPNRSTDLDVFSLVYLTCQSPQDSILDKERDRHYPLYRNGANYRFDRATFERAALSGDSFLGLRKPGPNERGKVKFNVKVEEFLEKNRASFLVPHINVLDLTNTLNLLTFIHNRARFLPREFVYLDHDAMYMGACVRILTGATDPSCSIHFKTFNDRNEPGFPVKPLFSYQHQKWEQTPDLARDGQPLHSMGGWLTLQSQAVTYLFLADFCQQMLGLAKEQPVNDPLNSLSFEEILSMETAAAKAIEATRGDKQVETLDDIEAIRQYESPHDGTNFQRYDELLTKQRDEAEQHVSILFDDPDYFARAIIEEKEHHWSNLCVGYDEARPGPYIQNYYDNTSTRHALYLDCMRAVLRKAFFEFFIWDAVWRALRDLESFENIWCPEPSRLKYVGGGKTLITRRSQLSSKTENDRYLQTQRKIQILLRQAATFFIFEFRKKAIHAASAPMRDTYCIPNADNKPAGLANSYYTTPDIELNFRHQASHEERSQVPRMVLELIENFISNRSSSMSVGIRKTTARILRYFEECEADEKTSEKFSNLIRGNIKGLNILSEIVDHMDHHAPDAFQYFHIVGDNFGKKIRAVFSEVLGVQNSYDLLALDGCAFGPKHVPKKRMARMFSFLDEIQGIGSRNENSYGAARGDIKRFGSSLLKGLIFPLARKDKNLDYELRFGPGFIVSKPALDRLTRHMRIAEDQWPFYPDEKPWNNLDDVDAANPKHYQGIWKDLKEYMKELSKQNRKKLKKPWKNSFKSSNAFDFVADEVKLAEATEGISKR
ncbi:hypothetical protein FLAG1_05081 [Fusarium langsethiae]|uniref:Uncharacterized protein n=1 Tax=Fusarium langsethiae TaxID=179993 RepID=A0A0N0DF31_FUSLA|nr:hypothetical protein FLAG1_05081 [Fusarium langsethiae]GKU10792.1 unnamed protein product [Fusarium langsethiae]GKU19165.1 unnamed protein product [Fusarium langsethiae]